MNEIISNATPLIAFSRIGQLPLLQAVVGNIIIPEAVAEEISDYHSSTLGGVVLSDESWITVEILQSETFLRLLLPTLDRGEASVIALALERKVTLVLIDELTGRKVATSLQLNVLGSVGVLIKAKQSGLISAVKPMLYAMREAGVYYSQRFVDEVLRYVSEN